MLAYLLTCSAGGVPVYMAAVLVAGNPAGFVPASSTCVLDLAADRDPSIASSVQTATFADDLHWSFVRPEVLPDGKTSMLGMRATDATDRRGADMTGTPYDFAYEPALLIAAGDGSLRRRQPLRRDAVPDDASAGDTSVHGTRATDFSDRRDTRTTGVSHEFAALKSATAQLSLGNVAAAAELYM